MRRILTHPAVAGVVFALAAFLVIWLLGYAEVGR